MQAEPGADLRPGWVWPQGGRGGVSRPKVRQPGAFACKYLVRSYVKLLWDIELEDELTVLQNGSN